jgi:predicted nucleic acid-binding protein
MGQRKESGRPLSIPDGQIAAIARAHGATIATRNIRDFVDCGIELINPFSEEENVAV